jgi:hypothetical protein
MSVIHKRNLPIFKALGCKFDGLRKEHAVKVKVKITLKQATKAQRRSRGITPLFF